MLIKNSVKILLVIISLILLLSLMGCISSSTDETQIVKITKNIEKAIEEKDEDLFMESISYNYSVFSKIEDAEDLIDAFSILKIEIKVTIPESDLAITDIYANGKMNIKISLEACIFWVVCTDLYNENIEYNVDFIKEEDNWKIISMEEI